MKRVLAVLLVLAMCIGFAATTAAAEAEPVKLTFWTFQELHTDFMKAMEELWNANPENTKIALDMQVYPYEDMHNKLTIALQSGEGAPDIVDIEINKFANYLKGEIQLAEMNEYVEKDADKFVMSRFNNYAKDGKYYGVDYHIGIIAAFYNDSLLKSAGIDYTTIKTWDDLHEAGKKFKEATGKPIITFETTDCWSIYPMLTQHGTDLLTLDNKVRMNEPLFVETLAFVTSMVDDGTAVPTPGGYSHTEEYYGWMNAEGAAAIVMPFWYIDRFTNYMPDLAGKMKIAAMPTWTDGGYKTSQGGGTGTAVVKTSPNVELAKAFLAYAKMSYEGCLNVWKICGFDPIRTDVYADKAMTEDNKFFQYYGQNFFDVLVGMMDSVADTAITSEYPVAVDVVKSQMMHDLLINGMDPAEVAANCAEEVENSIY